MLFRSYMIRYKTLLESLRKSTREYKDILKYKKKAIKAYKAKPIKCLRAVKTLVRLQTPEQAF